jgi:hypothetical protein
VIVDVQRDCKDTNETSVGFPKMKVVDSYAFDIGMAERTTSLLSHHHYYFFVASVSSIADVTVSFQCSRTSPSGPTSSVIFLVSDPSTLLIGRAVLGLHVEMR